MTTTTTTTIITATIAERICDLLGQGGFTLGANLETGQPLHFVLPLGEDVDTSTGFACEIEPVSDTDGYLSVSYRYSVAVANILDGVPVPSDSDLQGVLGEAWAKVDDFIDSDKFNDIAGNFGVGLGGWIDDDKFYLDVVALFGSGQHNLGQVLGLAELLNEIAVFDFQTCSEIPNPDYVAETEGDNSSAQTPSDDDRVKLEWVASVEQWEYHASGGHIFSLSDEFGEGKELILSVDWADEDEAEVLAVLNCDVGTEDEDAVVDEACDRIATAIALR